MAILRSSGESDQGIESLPRPLHPRTSGSSKRAHRGDRGASSPGLDLRQRDVFTGLTSGQRSRVMALGTRQKLQRDETLFAQGEQHRGVYLVESGLIRTFYTSTAGREITLAYWQPGNIVGTPHVLSSSRHSWSGVAAVPTEVLWFRSEDIRTLIERIPAFAVAMVETLEFKGWSLSVLVQMLGTRSVAERLSMLLYNLAELHGVPVDGGVALGRPFTHEVLAHMVGASRQWVTITLDRFEREGLLRVERQRVVLLKPQRLRSRRGRKR